VARSTKQELDRLCQEPFDPWVGVGCAVRASVRAVDGHGRQARRELHDALTRWVDWQASAHDPPSVENAATADALGIRDVLFQLEQDRSRHGQRPPRVPPFLFVESTLGRDEVRTLWRAVELLSQCDQGGRHSRRLDDLWNATVGCSATYCMASGKTWFTPPAPHTVRFVDRARTAAHVQIDLGVHGGREAVVVKDGDAWRWTSDAAGWEY